MYNQGIECKEGLDFLQTKINELSEKSMSSNFYQDRIQNPNFADNMEEELTACYDEIQRQEKDNKLVIQIAQQLISRVQEQEDQIFNFSEQNESSHDQMHLLEQQVDQLQEKCEAQSAHLIELEQSNEDKANEITQLEQDKEEYENKIVDLREINDAQKKRLSTSSYLMQNKDSENQERFEIQEEEIQLKNQEIDTLKQQLDEMAEKVDDLEDKHDTLNSQHSEVKARVAELGESRDYYRKNCEKLNKKVKYYTDKLEDTQNKLKLAKQLSSSKKKSVVPSSPMFMQIPQEEEPEEEVVNGDEFVLESPPKQKRLSLIPEEPESKKTPDELQGDRRESGMSNGLGGLGGLEEEDEGLGGMVDDEMDGGLGGLTDGYGDMGGLGEMGELGDDMIVDDGIIGDDGGLDIGGVDTFGMDTGIIEYAGDVVEEPGLMVEEGKEEVKGQEIAPEISTPEPELETKVQPESVPEPTEPEQKSKPFSLPNKPKLLDSKITIQKLKDLKKEKDEKDQELIKMKSKKAPASTNEARDPLKDFFVLSAQAAKLNSPYMNAICSIDTEELYQKALIEGIPFNQWSGWIEDTLHKSVISQIIRSRPKPNGTITASQKKILKRRSSSAKRKLNAKKSRGPQTVSNKQNKGFFKFLQNKIKKRKSRKESQDDGSEGEEPNMKLHDSTGGAEEDSPIEDPKAMGDGVLQKKIEVKKKSLPKTQTAAKKGFFKFGS